MEDQITLQNINSETERLLKTLRQACKKIAPVWPLENFVAVNPYLGLTDQKFETVAQELARIGGIQMTLPASFYLTQIRQGKITRDDIATALSRIAEQPQDADTFIRNLEQAEPQTLPVETLATLSDVATQLTGKDWNRFATARISTWAASYFDRGQAVWVAADQTAGLFAAWKEEAAVDRTPEIAGLKAFRKAVKALPQHPLEAAQVALETLDVPDEGLPVYLHRLLLGIGGWSAYAARLDWDNELYGGQDGQQIELLSILICWEACLFKSLDSPKLRTKWEGAKNRLSEKRTKTEHSRQVTQNLILQEAFDLATQRELIGKFRKQNNDRKAEVVAPKAQAIFCIDVRSEVYRRNLELIDQEIETIGFAGFFGFPIKFVPLAHDTAEAQCPVLIKTGSTILETMPDEKANQQAYQGRMHFQQVQQLWKSFRSGAVTCFSFVSPLGLSYLPKLFTDSFGLTQPAPHPDEAGLKKQQIEKKTISLTTTTHHHGSVGMTPDQRVQTAKNALRAMSLTDKFAPLVLIVGHGSTSVNNPYATGLDCGACGGHSGEANARVAAAVLNDMEVRERLRKESIDIPDHTFFLACLHDTTTDEITLFNEAELPASRNEEVQILKQSLAKVGQASRTERAIRMSVRDNVDSTIKSRSRDWSQVRPEWGLAGCSVFVVAPRERTRGIDFGGRSFLHSYEWKKDQGFSTLELIMTAPMVVASWISLQYYASTVDNRHHGSGNKTLHNVTSGLGVLEGYSGDLRVGLPLQSVHDGEKYQHEPVRLSVIIEAPIEAMNAVLEKHDNVRKLCDNKWIQLMAMDESGQVSHRYESNMNWREI